MTKQVINPDHVAFKGPDGESSFEKYAYSAAVRAGDFVYVAGQIGLNPNGSLPDNYTDQFRNAFDRLKLVLGEAGLSLADVVELVSYHVGLHEEGHLPSFLEIKDEYVPAPHPTWTCLGIESLARPGLLIEIKATAYAPAA